MLWKRERVGGCVGVGEIGGILGGCVGKVGEKLVKGGRGIKRLEWWMLRDLGWVRDIRSGVRD